MDAEIRHRLELLERKELRVTGVSQVESFTDTEIGLETALGFLVLTGESLHITQLNLDEGTLVVEGRLTSLQYREGGKRGGRQRARGMLNRILR